MRWMADTAQLCPWTKRTIMAAIKSSAEAAIKTCTGGENGRMCGLRWGSRKFDGDVDLGQEMGVLSALMTMLLFEDYSEGYGDYRWFPSYSKPVDPDDLAAGGGKVDSGHRIKPPLTHDTGGTSIGNPYAGQGKQEFLGSGPIQDTDTIMAVVLTTVFMMGGFIMFVWMSIDELSPRPKKPPRNVRQLEDTELQLITSKANHPQKEPAKCKTHDLLSDVHSRAKTARMPDSRSKSGPQLRSQPAGPSHTRLSAPWIYHENSIRRARRAANDCLSRGTRPPTERRRLGGQHDGGSQDSDTFYTRVRRPGYARTRSLSCADERRHGQFEIVRHHGGGFAYFPGEMAKAKPDAQPGHGDRFQRRRKRHVGGAVSSG